MFSLLFLGDAFNGAGADAAGRLEGMADEGRETGSREHPKRKFVSGEYGRRHQRRGRLG